jgi:hypothetical protein
MVSNFSEPQPSDSEILDVVATHPKIDILLLLSKSYHDPYDLTRELGLTFKSCHSSKNT